MNIYQRLTDEVLSTCDDTDQDMMKVLANCLSSSQLQAILMFVAGFVKSVEELINSGIISEEDASYCVERLNKAKDLSGAHKLTM